MIILNILITTNTNITTIQFNFFITQTGMSYGRNFPHSTPTSKRSASCSNNPPKLAGSTANNNNHFYSRYSTSPAMSLIQQSQGPYSPSAYRHYKGASYLHNAKYEGLSRYRTRDPVSQRDVPVKSTYRPDNLNDWNYTSSGRQDSHFGSLTKPARNVDVSDLSLSGLSVSSPLSIKKSTSHQDMSGSNQPSRYHLSTNYPRPLPDLRGSVTQRRAPQSTVHSSRRSSFTRAKILEDSRDGPGFVRSSVADTVARLNRRNEAERANFSGRLEGSPDDPSEGERNEVSNEDNNCESTPSSTTNSPNNNTNNFSVSSPCELRMTVIMMAIVMMVMMMMMMMMVVMVVVMMVMMMVMMMMVMMMEVVMMMIVELYVTRVSLGRQVDMLVSIVIMLTTWKNKCI